MGSEVSSLPPRPYLREEVYRRLREHVAELAATSTQQVSLREADLARQLGVSRTPVREALNRLQQEGIVEVLPHKGAKVLPTTLDEYLCWLEIREVLEGVATRRAAERIAPKAVRELRDLFAPFEAPGVDAEAMAPAFFEANARFHSRIIEESGAPFLQRLGQAYDYMGSGRRRSAMRLGRLAQALAEHRAILDALEQHDAGRAEMLAREHVSALREAVAARAGQDAATQAGDTDV